MMFVKKTKGFTVIELLVVIAIIAILFVTTVPNYGKLQDQREFQAEVQEVFDVIATARNNALVNKKCDNGEEAKHWEAMIRTISANDNTVSFTLVCEDRNSVRSHQLPFSSGEYKEDGYAVVEHIYLNGSTTSETFNREYLYVGFVPGSAQAKVYFRPTLDEATKVLVSEQFEYEFEMRDNTDKKASICMNTIGSFLEIRQYDQDCTEEL